jgi:hypothetical protein
MALLDGAGLVLVIKKLAMALVGHTIHASAQTEKIDLTNTLVTAALLTGHAHAKTKNNFYYCSF